jgi:hypothetical protein
MSTDEAWSPLIVEGLTSARVDAVARLSQSLTVMTAKLRAASRALSEFTSTPVLH